MNYYLGRQRGGCPNLASHTLRRERKALVTLQPSSCRHDRHLMWPIRSTLFVDRIRCHGVQLRHVFSECQHLILATTMVNNYVPRRQLGICSVTRPFLSLRRVWLVRLGNAPDGKNKPFLVVFVQVLELQTFVKWTNCCLLFVKKNVCANCVLLIGDLDRH